MGGGRNGSFWGTPIFCKTLENKAFVLQPPRPATGVSRPSGPEVFRECPSGCSSGCLPGPECPKSVPGVSGHLSDAPGTLSGHFLDIPEPGARRAPETPRGTLLGHFRPEGPERLL